MAAGKKLSSAFSTGGGGAHFEEHVQSSYVVLMLTGGYAPCLPCWPISEIKLQGKIDGYETDDLIVFVTRPNSKEQRKLLGQIKHSIAITQGSSVFGEVIQAAWNDFNNAKVFAKGKDAIALITGSISTTDSHNVQWLLDQARHTKDVGEFIRNVRKANFSPPQGIVKLEVFKHHLKAANEGNDVPDNEIYNFLKHFYLLGYDLGKEYGVVLSLLHSHMSQFQLQSPELVWGRVGDIVQTWNQNAGSITYENLPDDIKYTFKQKNVKVIPEEYTITKEAAKTNWAQHADATYLSLALLLGSWNEKNKNDTRVVSQFLGISHEDCLKKAREILQLPDSPLKIKNGTWKVVGRVELINLLGSSILDQDLESFKKLTVEVLSEIDPAFDLPTEERYSAGILGKVFSYSNELRKGLAEGLAIIGSFPGSFSNCSQGKAESISLFALREIFSGANWLRWGSLNSLLPTIAEAHPGEFFRAVEQTLRLTPCPFDELFSQEGKVITGGNYLVGLLWALEGLAWDEQYLVRVCVVLGELASHDPGGQWSNRPANSLSTILLPWLPQTLASAEKQKVAVEKLVNEWPDVAWNLIIQLLPGQGQTSFGSYKPKWRNIIPGDWKNEVTKQDYWELSSYYAQFLVKVAGNNTSRISALIDNFNNLPQQAFDQLIEVLSSSAISEIPEEQRLSIWDHLTKFTNKHRRFSDAKWALPDELISRIEKIAKQLAPTNPFNLYQHLFTDRDFDLYEENGDWKEQQKQLDTRRETAISEIFEQDGIEGVIRFADSVSSPSQVGHSLGDISDSGIELTLLPYFLDSTDNKRKALVGGYIWRRYYLKGWEWCDDLDKSVWTPKQVGQFLACLPFTKETWNRASEWLQTHEKDYWTRTGVNAYQADSDLTIAIEKLIEYGRPHAAINCLDNMRMDKQTIDSDQCARALLAAISSRKPSYDMDSYHIIELIKFLQGEPSANEDDLFKVEWAYLSLLDRHRGARPQFLENKLATDPAFFCEIIRLIYRSKKEEPSQRNASEERQAIATNAWRLLHGWKTPPGTQQNGTFNEEHFTEWLQAVKAICTKSGHLEVALIKIGEVLIHTPADKNGLWINRVVAKALNDQDAENMRNGFSTGTYNSRGVHCVDPTGKPEKELAEQFRTKAEKAENEGFQRFAVTLRDLADNYDKEAEQIISEYKQEGNE